MESGYATPPKGPLVTSKPLAHHRPYSKEYLEMKKFFKTHDISMKKDPETGKVVCKAVKKWNL